MNFLRDHLYDTEAALQVGTGRYTWQSFNISKYCDTIKALMRKLKSIVSQINYIRVDIQNRINQMRKFNIFAIDMSPSDRKEPLIQFDALDSSEDSESSIDNQVEIIRIVESEDSILEEQGGGDCGTGIFQCQGYVERLEQYRTEQCSHMKRLYDSLGPVLIKLESLVLGTFTGRSLKMREYYVYWEQQNFKCLLE